MKPSNTETGKKRCPCMRIRVSREINCLDNFIWCKCVWFIGTTTSRPGYSITEFSSLFANTMAKAFQFDSLIYSAPIKSYFFDSFVWKIFWFSKKSWAARRIHLTNQHMERHPIRQFFRRCHIHNLWMNFRLFRFSQSIRGSASPTIFHWSNHNLPQHSIDVLLHYDRKSKNESYLHLGLIKLVDYQLWMMKCKRHRCQYWFGFWNRAIFSSKVRSLRSNLIFGNRVL